MIARGRLPALLAAVLLSVGCSPDESAETPAPGPPSAPPSAATQTPETSDDPAPVTRPVGPSDFEADAAMRSVRHLAGTIGPRLATGPAYRRAADWVATELADLGYTVRRQGFDVPAGDSWGVPVRAGRSTNVVATPPGLDLRRPHLVVGAHLDTVAVSPGAEDNGSGVAVLLEAARAAAHGRTRLPVVWVAFGGEEPRGPGDDDHHYGSRAHVASMDEAQRQALRAMVSLDRVGVGAVVPVGSAGMSDPVQQQLLAAARRTRVDAVPDSSSRSSDHWSFVRAGLPAARLGSTSYAAYHSSGDVASVVSAAQLARVGQIVLEWLAPR